MPTWFAPFGVDFTGRRVSLRGSLPQRGSSRGVFRYSVDAQELHAKPMFGVSHSRGYLGDIIRVVPVGEPSDLRESLDHVGRETREDARHPRPVPLGHPGEGRVRVLHSPLFGAHHDRIVSERARSPRRASDPAPARARGPRRSGAPARRRVRRTAGHRRVACAGASRA
jgi:hypothetical protein